MSEDDILKIAIGVTSAFAGWILAQLTSGTKTWLQRRKVRKLLLEELSDLDKQIDRLIFFYSRQLEVHGSKSISSESAAGLTNPIFTNYYKDALLSLNQSQRISYQLIHSLVEHIDSGLQNIREQSSEVYKRHALEGMTKQIAKLCETWGTTVKAQYQSCASLQWQIRFHLQHKSGPDLSPYTDAHKDYLHYLKRVQEKADSFVANGKTIDPGKFNELYNPGSFPQGPAP